MTLLEKIYKNDVMILSKALKIRYTLIKAYLVEIWRWARIQLKRQKVETIWLPKKKDRKKNKFENFKNFITDNNESLLLLLFVNSRNSVFLKTCGDG